MERSKACAKIFLGALALASAACQTDKTIRFNSAYVSGEYTCASDTAGVSVGIDTKEMDFGPEGITIVVVNNHPKKVHPEGFQIRRWTTRSDALSLRKNPNDPSLIYVAPQESPTSRKTYPLTISIYRGTSEKINRENIIYDRLEQNPVLVDNILVICK